VFVRDRKLGTTRRVSVSSTGAQANADISRLKAAAISSDGRYVAFSSLASNLVPDDTNTTSDVFVRDRKRDTTRRVSVSSTGTQANGDSLESTISSDGRYVAFGSGASYLVPGDTNVAFDVFIRDRKRDTTRRVSVSETEAQAIEGSVESAAISSDGRYVAFVSYASHSITGDTNIAYDVFVRDGCWAPPAGSACPRPKPRPSRAASSRRRSVRTAGTWRSDRTRRTWCG
jgi:archaellum component FlaF (FlaF/FlaG flagellin family)